MRVPPPDEAGMRMAEGVTERLPPINGLGDRSRSPVPQPAYAGQPASPRPYVSPAGAPTGAVEAAEPRSGASRLGEDHTRWDGAPDQPLDPAVAGRGVLVGVLVVLSLIAAVAPQSAICLVWALLALVRVVDHANTALLVRRQQFGQRGSDAVVVGLSLPWRALIAALSSLFLLILPILIGISITFIAAGVLAGGAERSIPSGPGSLAFGMAAILLSSWFGLGGGAVRRGARLVLRKTVCGRRSRLITWAVIALLAIAALMVMSHQASPDWGTWEGTWLVRQLSH